MSLVLIPEVYFFRHTKETVPTLNLMTSVQIEGGWYMLNDPSMLFVLDGANVPEISGTGNQTFQIKMTNEVNDYDIGFYETKLEVYSADGLEHKTLIIYLFVTETSSEVVMPKSLNFEAVRNVREAAPQKIYIATSDSGLSYTPPPFLEMVSHELVGSGHIYEVAPIAHVLTPNKEYEGYVDIAFTKGSIKRVKVNYKINAGYDESFTRSVHFSRDNEELHFYRTTPENSFLKLIVGVKSFTDTGALHRDFELDLDFPFVGDLAKIDIGKEIEPYFQDDAEPRLVAVPESVYPPIELRINAFEIKYEDFSIINQDVLPLQYFLRGRNPLVLKQIVPFWADYRPSIERLVSAKGLITLTAFKPAGSQIKPIEMRVNDRFEKFLTPRTQKFGIMRPYFYTVTVNLATLDLTPGDEITFLRENELPVRKYVIRHNVKISNLVAYQTVYNTFDIFEMTGNLRFPTEFVHDMSSRLKKNLLASKKVSSENSQKLLINTGWIMKDELFVLNEMILAQSAFLLPVNTRSPITQIAQQMIEYESECDEKIELVPVQSKLLEFDSDTQMYQFDVEFLINPNYENKIYSR